MRRISTQGGEGVHPVAGLLRRADAAIAELIELIEARQLDLELQGGSFTVAAHQRHQHPGIEAIGAGGLDLAMDKLDPALAIDRQHVIVST
jgi:hypothetical protein